MIIGLLISASLLSLSILWATNKKTVKTDDSKKDSDSPSYSCVMELTKENAQAVIDKIPTVIIIDFYAPWCGPCRTLKPIFEEIAQEFKNVYGFAKINVDNCQEVAKKYQISSLPTIAIISQGKMLGKIVGLQSKETLIEKINQVIKGPQDLSKLDKKALNEKLIQTIQTMGGIDEIKPILEAGADVNYSADNGINVLISLIMITAMRRTDSIEILKLLLEYGISTELTDMQTGKKYEALDFVKSSILQWKQMVQNFENIAEFLENEATKKEEKQG